MLKVHSREVTIRLDLCVTMKMQQSIYEANIRKKHIISSEKQHTYDFTYKNAKLPEYRQRVDHFQQQANRLAQQVHLN